MSRRLAVKITLLWAVWSIVLLGYMQLARLRYAPARPDDALVWTADFTTFRSLEDKPYLTDPFLNTQVAYDSEYYLSIAIAGYDDPQIQTVADGDGTAYSLSHAFFPLYPLAMRYLSVPLSLFRLSPIGTATLAGVIISLVGTLAGALALADIAQSREGDDGAVRAVSMMLIFPTALFFATVYTEGLFIGLAFSSLAMLRRRQWVAAAVLALFATWTRTVGVALVVPLLFAWGNAYRTTANRRQLLTVLPALFLPVVAYLIWRWALGTPFDIVQREWFGGRIFDLPLTADAWHQLLKRAQTYPETAVHAALQLGGLALALVSLLWNLRRYPELALFGLVALLVPSTAGWTGTQSSLRYVLAAPTLWLLLSRWGRNPHFERGWTLLSVLLLAMQAYLFSFDFWAG